MYQGGHRHGERPYQVPPPPPMPNPAAGGHQMNNMTQFPPPPPRYPGAASTPAGMVAPPPPGPPPGSAMGQQAPWHGNFGRVYDSRGTLMPPPPPSSGQHQPYNPQHHAQVSGQTMAHPPPPPPPNEQMSATYIPQGDTYGEVAGFPAFGPDDWAGASGATMPAPNFYSSTASNPQSATDTNQTTPLDNLQARGLSNASNATNTTNTSSIPPEIAAQWPLETVLLWLAKNQFSKDWQETFRGL